ncbi:MAG: LysE family transporter, partial [Deltaproteobacteria bacterium]|nr:LysE family transporter [Deltaproteobacteria bacterium]
MGLFQGLLLVTVIHTLAAAAPGPDFVLVSQQTLANGKKAGLLCSLGISLGLSVHIIYSAFGLATVIANSADLLELIKIMAGCYLMFLGFRGLRVRSARGEMSAAAAKKTRSLKYIGTGFVCNVLNPKAPIYFVSLFTLVLSPEMPVWQLAVYGAWIMLIQLAWFSFVASLLSFPVINSRFRRAGHWIDRLLGG